MFFILLKTERVFLFLSPHLPITKLSYFSATFSVKFSLFWLRTKLLESLF